MPKERYSDHENCNAIARLIKDMCSCTENGAWSPDMTSQKRRDPFLKSELTNMSAMRRRIMTIAKRKTRKLTPEPPKLSYTSTLEKSHENLTTNLISNTLSSEDSTLRRNIDSFLQSRRMFAIEEDLYETPIQRSFKNSNCGENWSLSKAWKSNHSDFFHSNPQLDNTENRSSINRNYGYLERIDEVPRKKRKEQMRYDRNIKRHIRIRVMLSLRMRRYMKRRLRKGLPPVHALNIPPRRFPRGASVTSSFGTRSYKSVLVDKLGDGAVVFDVHEARNTTMELCHDYEDDLDTLDIALRAGNFR